jgi:hypothetical protein
MTKKHAEAFCHMQYAYVGPKKTIYLTIFNSRDGVTPFCFHSKEFGVTLQHVKWQEDKYDPDYVPVSGDLIWRDVKPEEKLQWLQDHKASLAEVPADNELYAMAQHFLAELTADPSRWLGDINDGEPVLELIS